MPKNKKIPSPWCCFGSCSNNNNNNNKFDLKASILEEDSLSSQPQAVKENLDASTKGKAPLVRAPGRHKLSAKKVLNPTLSNEEFEIIDPNTVVPTDPNAPQDEFKSPEPSPSQLDISIDIQNAVPYFEEEEQEETKEDMINNEENKENIHPENSDLGSGSDNEYQDAEEESIIKELEQRLEALSDRSDFIEKDISDNTQDGGTEAINDKSEEAKSESPNRPKLVIKEKEILSNPSSNANSEDESTTPIKSSSEPSLSDLDSKGTSSKKTSLSDSDISKPERPDTPRPAMLLSTAVVEKNQKQELKMKLKEETETLSEPESNASI